MDESRDIFFMSEALALAKQAYALGEVPVGAVVVRNGEIIGKGFNKREALGSATAHAEIIAIEEACKALGTWRLDGCTLYVSMEPCPMCAGAIVNSRIRRVVFGCKDAVAGCCGSVLDLNAYPFNHSFELTSGVLEKEAKELLGEFFKEKRKVK